MKAGIVSLALILAFVCCAQAEKRVVCYFGTWSVYRPGDGKFDVEDVDPFLCTHVIYSFVGLGDDSKIRILDPWQDLADDYGKDGFRRFTNLKKINPNLKTLLAIGGWNEGSTKYSQLLRNPQNRRIFIQDAVSLLKKFNFDGLDLDWEYPNQRGGIAEDVDTFTSWCKELREEFDKHGLLVTAAVAAAESSHSQSYSISEISKHLNFINVMTYDFHGAWEKVTGHNAPLHTSQEEIGTHFEEWNVEKSIKSWIAHGADPEKLLVGIGAYGRSFTLASSTCIAPRCPAPSAGIAGPWTREAGMLGYYEACLKENRAQIYWDDEAMVPYMVDGNQWIGYDNIESVKRKMAFVKEMNLGGAMVWSIDTDDFRGTCGKGKFPLISTMRNELNGVPSMTTTTTTRSTTTDNSGSSAGPTVAPTPEPTEVCKHVGYNRDPHDCSVFYQCTLVNGVFKHSRFQCSADLLFDIVYSVCNFKHLVDCS